MDDEEFWKGLGEAARLARERGEARFRANRKQLPKIHLDPADIEEQKDQDEDRDGRFR